MTFLEVSYAYDGPLKPAQLRRLSDLTGHYGILGIFLEENRHVARIRFDASRLKESEAVHWVRLAGIPLTERVAVNSVPAKT